jgi:hypothetical protein
MFGQFDDPWAKVDALSDSRDCVYARVRYFLPRADSEKKTMRRFGGFATRVRNWQ